MLKCKPAGQTILEVLIAVFIIINGIVSMISLLIYIQSSSRLTYQEAIALGLAQEAIEAARFVRDSNWLDREAGGGANFYDGLVSNPAIESNDYTAIYKWEPLDSASNAITFNFIPDTSSDTTTRVYQTSFGQYQQTTGSTRTLTETAYTRFVTLYPICSADGGITESFITADGQACVTTYSGTKQIGIQVKVIVTWLNGGETQTRTLEERLYDWKYAQ